jgi:hypothetical protein
LLIRRPRREGDKKNPSTDVIHIEAGRIPDPRVSTVKALADALGCTLDDLMADQPPREPRRRGPRDGKGKRKRGKGDTGRSPEPESN